MKVRGHRDVRDQKFHLRFTLEEFSEDEVFLISRYGPLSIWLNANVEHRTGNSGFQVGAVGCTLQELINYEFRFDDDEAAGNFESAVYRIVKNRLEELTQRASNYVGESVVEIRVGEEIKKINDGAKKAIDRNSEEYRDVILKNREAFERLSKL